MQDIERLSGRERVSKKRAHSERFEQRRQARIQEYQDKLAPMFDNVEDVEFTPVEKYILVKHDGVFDLVGLDSDQATCLDRTILEGIPELKAWWDEYFD